MGNVAMQCPTCRGNDVTKAWTYGNAYYRCGHCGFIWS
jgi:transposase-like protein